MSVVPFGVEVASRVPGSAEYLDPAALIYDPEQQLTVTRGACGAVMPLCLAKHTDGPTRVDSNTDGKGNPEWDNDVQED